MELSNFLTRSLVEFYSISKTHRPEWTQETDAAADAVSHIQKTDALRGGAEIGTRSIDVAPVVKNESAQGLGKRVLKLGIEQ